jgi:hypothetical protein
LDDSSNSADSLAAGIQSACWWGDYSSSADSDSRSGGHKSYQWETNVMLIYFSLLVAIVGVLMYALSMNAKIVEIGRIMFWTGLLAFLLTGVPHLVSVIK